MTDQRTDESAEDEDEDWTLRGLDESRGLSAVQRRRLIVALSVALLLPFAACVHSEWQHGRDLRAGAVQDLEGLPAETRIPENLEWLLDESHAAALSAARAAGAHPRGGRSHWLYLEELLLHMERAAHDRGDEYLADELYAQYLAQFEELPPEALPVRNPQPRRR